MRQSWLPPWFQRSGSWTVAWVLAAGACLLVVCALVAPDGLIPVRWGWLGVALLLPLPLLVHRERGPDRPPGPGLLEALLQASPLPIFTLDRQGKVAGLWNPAAGKRFGLAEGMAVGAPAPLVLPGFQAEMARLLERVFQGEPVLEVRAQGVPREGASFPVTCSMTPVFGAGGEVEAAVVILGEDTAEAGRLATLAALLGDHAALLDAVKSAGVVVWSMDPVGGRLIYASSSALEVLGVGRDRLAAEPGALTDLLAPRDRDLFDLARAEALAGRVGTFDAPLARPILGRPRWTRWTLDLSDGRLRGVVQDITEARSLQEQLLHSQKLETVGAFLSSVTHDFNNILITILGCNELLLMDPALKPEQKRRLEIMQRGACRGQALATRLLRYARKGTSERRATALNDLVSEVIALLEDATNPRIRYRTDLDPALPPVLAEPTELHQVIMNLVVNARDALPDGGEVTLRTAQVDGGIQLEVRDTGPGIPADLRERIFEPFFTTKPGGKGTGLGLAVVDRVVTAHGGTVTCASGEDGTVFRVIFPA